MTKLEYLKPYTGNNINILFRKIETLSCRASLDMITLQHQVMLSNVSLNQECFVRSLENQLGIGKIVTVDQNTAQVEYFVSIQKRITKNISLNQLRKATLSKQTRCYVWLEFEECWKIGRIEQWDRERNQYEIHLPNTRLLYADEASIYVRCNLPIDDPIETLAAKGHDTPYFYDRRLTFVQSVIKQRAVSRGMTGLFSANITLHPHQVEVVRRVLEDPIQRYLLADEVGLGKTIEAGAILRQYLLDESEGNALILVPKHLLQQWRQELKNKFYISEDCDRVRILAVNDLHEVNFNKPINFLIIDEAHHVAGDQQYFETCRRLAHQTQRLLLLSATPVLNHEQDFLAMLHLLDPVNYHLEDLEGFRERIKNRQDIGRILLSFREGTKPFVLKRNITRLKTLFAEDKYLIELTEKLEGSLQTSEISSENCDCHVRTIRNHISETYRLHRRMLRNRRESVQDVIFDRNAIPSREYDLDERSPRIYELIDEWRTIAPEELPYQRLFLLLFRASSTWLGVLQKVVETRLQSYSQPELIQDWKAGDIQLLIETPLFPDEADVLEALLQELRHPSEEGDRIELLKQVIINHLVQRFKLSMSKEFPELVRRVRRRIEQPFSNDYFPKIVIFTSFSQVAEALVKSLSETFGGETVASHVMSQSSEETEANFQRFRDESKCFILVCDRSGEEGRNLQFTDWLIHFDFPWCPNQLEQRIGRVDRIGSRNCTKYSAFVGPDLAESFQDAWYQLLKQGFRIFNRSIASLQFYVDEKLPTLETLLFEAGASGLLAEIKMVRQEIEEELLKISEQNTLDEIDALDDETLSYFNQLDDYDANHKEIKRATEGWLLQALKFKKTKDNNLETVRAYEPIIGATLVPTHDLINRFASYEHEPGTYNRRKANQYDDKGVRLYRIGEGLIDALADYIHWDDRGKAFALWRYFPNWDAEEGMEWFGFQFNYVIEANLAEAIEVLNNGLGEERINTQALQRQADALFPPLLETIFLDARFEPMQTVEDVSLLKILQYPYNKKSTQYKDCSLTKNKVAILSQFFETSDWSNLCQKARTTSDSLLRDRPSFIEICDRHANNAQRKLNHRVEQLRLRLNRLSAMDTELQTEWEIETKLSEALVAGIRYPSIRLDSVGFMIVSGCYPSVELVEEGNP